MVGVFYWLTSPLLYNSFNPDNAGAFVVKYFQRLRRLLWTMGYLKPSQIIFWVVRRMLPSRKVVFSGGACLKPTFSLQPLLAAVETFREEDGEESYFCQNHAAIFTSVNIDWCPKSQTRLWCYQLHYFDLLRDPNRSLENKRWFIDDWIAQNPQGREPAWEPYTTSLRTVNWLGFFASSAEQSALSQSWLDSLYEQVRWLERNDERHILANHYFENIKALLFAGVAFTGDDADRWLRKGQKKLTEQLEEQFLEDGGHYEGSPQYHTIVVAGCLDLYNLAQSNTGQLSEQLVACLGSVIVKGLTWLARIVRPDGDIPLFNDATLNGGPSLDELQMYATRLQLLPSEKAPLQEAKRQTAPTARREVGLIDNTASGIFGYRGWKDWLMITCSDIRPSYQPGHRHCDLLSYELILDGAPLIVDSGVYEYQPGPLRDYVRSTRAHNTCSVDGTEQSEIWGEFRVGRRACKLAATIAKENNEIIFRGLYTGFPEVKGRITHSRVIKARLNDSEQRVTTVTIADEIKGRGRHQVESYIHLHPEITLKDAGKGNIRLFHQGQVIAVVAIPEEFTYAIESSQYFPELGRKMDNQVIIIKKEGRLPVYLSYEIQKG